MGDGEGTHVTTLSRHTDERKGTVQRGVDLLRDVILHSHARQKLVLTPIDKM